MSNEIDKDEHSKYVRGGNGKIIRVANTKPSKQKSDINNDFSKWSPEQVQKFDKALAVIELANQAAHGYNPTPEARQAFQQVYARGLTTDETKLMGQYQAWRLGIQPVQTDTTGMTPEQIEADNNTRRKSEDFINSKFSVFTRNPDKENQKAIAPKKKPVEKVEVLPAEDIETRDIERAAPQAAAAPIPAATPAGLPQAMPQTVMTSAGKPLPPIVNQQLAMAGGEEEQITP